MRYRAFVASTREDLAHQREHVTQKLREGGLEVVAMEDFPSDPRRPARVSLKKLEECHFCVALVAFQRGSIAVGDPGHRSITQLEIDHAQQKGIPVLTFLLRDNESNRSQWILRFNHLADPAVSNWRKRLAAEKTCKFFDAHEMPDPLPAILQQITTREQRARRRALVGLVFVLIAGLGLGLSVLGSEPVRDWLIARLHWWHDPIVFNHWANGRCSVARLLQGTSELRAVDFGETIRGAKKSFALFANTFGSFDEHALDFRDAASRGVRLRFVLTDYAESNRANWATFLHAIGDDIQPDKETLTASEEAARTVSVLIRDKIRRLQREFPGNVELRLHRQPLFFTLWIRDPDQEQGAGHLGVHFYGQKANWPAFRVSTKTGSNHLAALTAQFDRIWEMSTPESVSAVADDSKASPER